MQYGLRIEKDMVIYVDHLGSENDSQWRLHRGQYELSDDAQIIQEMFITAAAKLKGRIIYSFAFNGWGTVWVTASKDIPIGFVGPLGCFHVALRHAHVQRVQKLEAERDIPVQKMLEEYYQKPFHSIVWEDLGPAWEFSPGETLTQTKLD